MAYKSPTFTRHELLLLQEAAEQMRDEAPDYWFNSDGLTPDKRKVGSFLKALDKIDAALYDETGKARL